MTALCDLYGLVREGHIYMVEVGAPVAFWEQWVPGPARLTLSQEGRAGCS